MRKRDNSIIITSIIAVVVIAVVLILVFTLKSSDGKTINVQGTAVVKAMPDLVTVYFNVETKADTAVEAKNNNSLIVAELTASLIALGFERDEIVTENFNVYPNYEWDERTRTEDGYIATHSIKIELSTEESDKIGEIIDAGVDAGANINYINFELSSELQNQYKAEAMKLAAKDAKIKAESVASGFDKSVGKLVSVQVNEFNYYPWNVYSSSGMGIAEDAVMAKEATVSIQPGEREISATVIAVYKMR